MTFHSIRQAPSKGSIRGSQKQPRVVIGFESTMFHRIAGEAERRKVPFAQVVRERLIEAYRGIETSGPVDE